MNNTLRSRTARPFRGASLALASLLCVCAVSACQAMPHAGPLSEDAVRLDLPLVQQDELYACGLASMSALAQSAYVPA